MTTPSEEAESAREEFARFLERHPSGEVIDRRALLRDHPELSGPLRLFLAGIGAGGPEHAHEKLDHGPRTGGARLPPGRARGSPSSRRRVTWPARSCAGCWTAAPWKRYEIQEEVARGGQGAILQVWDEDLGRNLAMKVVLGSPSGGAAIDPAARGPRSLGRFLEEAQVTGQLDHPGIVPVHELGARPERTRVTSR